MKIEIVRQARFCAAHLYNQPKWTVKKNREVFGACYSEHGHGHNYTLEVYFSGPVDSESGMIINLVDIDAILSSVVGVLDHKHLNFKVDYFKSVIPTTENIAIYCMSQVTAELKMAQKQKRVSSRVKIKRLRIYETPDLFVEVSN